MSESGTDTAGDYGGLKIYPQLLRVSFCFAGYSCICLEGTAIVLFTFINYWACC